MVIDCRLEQAGMKTMDLDRALHDMIIAKDAYPSPLGYQGYPRSITTSINNVICRKPKVSLSTKFHRTD